MSIIYPVNQNPTLYLDGTTLFAVGEVITFTQDLIKPIIDPLGFQVATDFPIFNPQQNEIIPYPVVRANIAAVVKIKAEKDDSIGAFQCAFKHVGVGTEDVIYVVPPTERTFWTFILFTEQLRDQFRIFNSSRSSFGITVLLVDAVRVSYPPMPISAFGPGVDVLIKNWEKMIEAYNQSFALPQTDPVSGQNQTVPVGVIRPCGNTPPGPIG